MKVGVLHTWRGLVYTEVDDSDYVYVNSLRLYVNDDNYIWFREQGVVYWLHRKLLNVTNPLVFVDHKDRNPLNNTRDNLRLATNSQNQMNSGTQIKANGLPKGVVKIKSNTKPYQAQIKCNGKYKYLGTFRTIEEAAVARTKAENELFKLNT